MANFTTDGKLCIEREIEINSTEKQFDDLVSRFDISETCQWITDNNFQKVNIVVARLPSAYLFISLTRSFSNRFVFNFLMNCLVLVRKFTRKSKRELRLICTYSATLPMQG